MLQAVIFDFDGLILDTETPEVRSWEHVFERFGATYPEAYWRYTLGRGAEQVRERPYDLLIQQLPPPHPEEEDVLRLRGGILSEMLAHLEVLPGVLDRLAEAKSMGMRLGVASSSRHAWVDGHLRRLGLIDEFDHIVCADDVKRAKPFPDLYIECCRRLGSVPEETVAFEDSVNGCLAAVEAGLQVVAVPTSLTVRVELPDVLVVDSLAQISLAELAARPRPWT